METDLTRFDNRIMNGLLFCKRTYDLFHRIRNSPNGRSRLRLRKGKLEKKLIEELIPIARYIQARYHQGRQLKVRWVDGGQSYDAKMFVNEGDGYRPQYLEATTVVHKNEHYQRKMIDEGQTVFGVKGIELRQNPKEEVSNPYCYRNDEYQSDLAQNILKRIESKAKINYPEKTVLVIQCFLDRGIITKAEWLDVIEKLESSQIQHDFYEISIFDSNGKYCHWL